MIFNKYLSIFDHGCGHGLLTNCHVVRIKMVQCRVGSVIIITMRKFTMKVLIWFQQSKCRKFTYILYDHAALNIIHNQSLFIFHTKPYLIVFLELWLIFLTTIEYHESRSIHAYTLLWFTNYTLTLQYQK